MKTLVIDTATKACSVALYDGDDVVASAHEVIGRGHAERLLPLISALPGCGKADRILVDVGPGSFTGIRVGVAAAKALGFAWRVPVHGFGGLELVAAIARDKLGRDVDIDVVMTGGHGEYFHQYYGADGVAPSGAVSVAPDALSSRLVAKAVAGDVEVDAPAAEHIELLPDASFWDLISSSHPLPPSPAYGRAPDAKLPQERAEMIEIIEGDARDIAAIMPIMADAFDPAFGEAWTASQCLSTLAMPGSRLLMAVSDDVVCGFTLSRWVLDNEELLMIGVDRSMQRRAIGSMLLGRVIALAKDEGRQQLFLEVRDGNPALTFYVDGGFQPIGRRKNYYKGVDGERFDAITMGLDIPK